MHCSINLNFDFRCNKIELMTMHFSIFAGNKFILLEEKLPNKSGISVAVEPDG